MPPAVKVDLASTFFALTTSIIAGDESKAILQCVKLLTIPNISAEAIALELVKLAPKFVRTYTSKYERMMNETRGTVPEATKQYWILLILLDLLGTVEATKGRERMLAMRKEREIRIRVQKLALEREREIQIQVQKLLERERMTRPALVAGNNKNASPQQDRGQIWQGAAKRTDARTNGRPIR